MTEQQKQIYEIVKKANPGDPLAYAQNAVKSLSIDVLNNAITECADCNRCNKAKIKKTLFNGNPNAVILIIGESVSKDQFDCEEEYLFPFENDNSYKYLEENFNYLNLDLNNIAFINSVNCYFSKDDDNNKRPPTVQERLNCKTFLDYAIKVVNPMLIICLGAVAVNGINEEIGKQNISKIRGNYFYYRGIPVMPTFHPAFFDNLLDSSEELAEIRYNNFSEDISKAINDLNNQIATEDLNINLFNKE